MQSCSNEVKQDVNRCIKKFGITEEQQKVMIDKIENQYGNETLAKYSSEAILSQDYKFCFLKWKQQHFLVQ